MIHCVGELIVQNMEYKYFSIKKMSWLLLGVCFADRAFKKNKNRATLIPSWGTWNGWLL